MRPPARPDCPASPTNVVPFRPVFRSIRADGFTVRDRIEALEWRTTCAVQETGLARLDIHAEHPGDDQETCDLLLLYRRDERWARWGVVRRADRIGVWRCADGADLGCFETMRQALDALLQADGQAARDRTPRAGARREVRMA